jgi:hypothetical protein
MKDLLVFTADADAEAVMRSVLGRAKTLDIRPVSFDIKRNPLRDSGMVKDGPELARLDKGKYGKVLLLWDYHGSGHERRHKPEASRKQIQDRLDGVTWRDHGCAIPIVPELEEWLWHCPDSVARYFGYAPENYDGWRNTFAAKSKCTVEQAPREAPKELFEFIVREKLRRTISPRDFEKIAALANLARWEDSPSFARVADILRLWFS